MICQVNRNNCKSFVLPIYLHIIHHDNIHDLHVFSSYKKITEIFLLHAEASIFFSQKKSSSYVELQKRQADQKFLSLLNKIYAKIHIGK